MRSTQDAPRRMKLSESLISDVAEGIYCLGVQAYVSLDHRVLLDLAAGIGPPGQPMRTSTSHNVWCATKPLAACHALAVLEREGFCIDEPVALRLHWLPESFHDLTVLDILTHSRSPTSPDAITARMLPPQERAHFARNGASSAAPNQGMGYSDFMGWFILGDLVANVTDSDPRDSLNSALRQYGIDEVSYGLDSAQYDRRRLDIGVYYANPRSAATPLLHETTRRFAADAEFGIGGFASMRGLGRWYEHLLRLMRSDYQYYPLLPSASLLRYALGKRRGLAWDAVLRRDCDFAAGFMTDLAHHHFGTNVGTGAIGHSGWLGASFAFVDPAVGLVAAFLYNGMLSEDDFRLLRPDLVRRCYELVSSTIGRR